MDDGWSSQERLVDAGVSQLTRLLGADWEITADDGVLTLRPSHGEPARRLLTALDVEDQRAVDVNVAGPSALLTAKSFKIHERLGSPERLSGKDAGDVLRLMMTSTPTAVAGVFEALLSHERVGEVASQGLAYLRDLFGGARTPGVEMAVRALAGSVPEQRVRALAPAFVGRLPRPR
ncbi:hypothetical protein ACTG9Q_10470 [Actinokineospora sp. 24-640]